MEHKRCDVCGADASLRLTGVQAWLCAACATKISRARRMARQRAAGQVTFEVAPLAIRSTESLYRHIVLHN